MAYNSVNVITDASNVTPIPQFYDPALNTYDPLTGVGLGGGRYGSDSLSWGKTLGGVYVPIQVDANGVVQTAQDNAPLSSAVVMQNAVNVNGNGTTLSTAGYGIAILSIVFSVSPAWSGTVNFEGLGPDGNWYPINGRLRGGSNAPTTTTTGGSGLYSLNVRGLQSIRARVSGYTAGSVTVTGQAQTLPSSDADEIANVSLSGSNIPKVNQQIHAVSTATNVAAGAFHEYDANIAGYDWYAASVSGVTGTSLNYEIQTASCDPKGVGFSTNNTSGGTGSSLASPINSYPSTVSKCFVMNNSATNSLTFTDLYVTVG